MNLTIIVLSKNNDKNLVKFLHEFLKNSPSCSLLIADYGQKRALLEKIINKRENISISYNQNRGIYYSINNCLKLITTKYYLVLGLDDELNFLILESFLNYLSIFNGDLLFAGVIKKNKKLLYLDTSKKNILNGPAGVFPSHTGGVAIKADLHSKYGNYSLNLKVTSDLLFISRCLLGNAKADLFNFYLCNIGDKGFSKQNEFLAEYECFLIRNILGASKFKSYLIYIYRLGKRKMKRGLSNSIFKRYVS